MTSFLQLVFQLYLKKLNENPLATKVATGAVLSGVGELLAQLLDTANKAPIVERVRRILALAGYGAVWSGPSMHFFQRALEAFATSVGLTGSGWGPVIVKTLIDQLTYGPACSLVFLAYMHGVVRMTPLSSVLRYVGKGHDVVGVSMSTDKSYMHLLS